MSLVTIPPLTLFESLFPELKSKDQTSKKPQLTKKSNEESHQFEQKQTLELYQQALLAEYNAFELKQRKLEQDFELKQREQRQADSDRELDLQRREAALADQIEQHATNVKNHKLTIAQERLSLERLEFENTKERLSLLELKIENQNEKARLLELEQRISSLVPPEHQITGDSLLESFQIESTPVTRRVPNSNPTMPRAEPLSALDLHYLKQISKSVEQRYAAAVQKEYSNQQERLELTNERNKFMDSSRLYLLQNDTNAEMTLDVIDFAMKQYPIEKLQVIKTLGLGKRNTKMILSMDEEDFKSNHFQEKIKLCNTLKLDSDATNHVLSLTYNESLTDQRYSRHLEDLKTYRNNNESLGAIIRTCNNNSQHYGKNTTDLLAEYRCPQLGKQVQVNYDHYSKLIDVLYSNQDQNSLISDHINPYDHTQTSSSATIFTCSWKSDYQSGKIPKLTPNLKLFFASPNITSGKWIQFYGPGAQLYNIDPTFVLYVGSLCDPNKKGEFTSVNDTSIATPAPAFASPYQILVKWE